MRAACYLRVSTGQQHSDNQLPDVERLARERGYDLQGYYAESESSWKQGHQKELARLLDDLRSGRRRYEVLVIWSIDRLSRGGIGQIFSLVHSFQQLGVRVISCKETWLDSAGPAGELLLAVVAWVSAFESQRKSERVKAGQARAISEGKVIGRPKGSKDRNGRRRAGYLGRWVNKSPAGIKAKAKALDRAGK